MSLFPHHIAVDPARVLRTLLLVTAALVVLSSVGQFLRYAGGVESALTFIPEFSLDDENNVPTFFSTLLLAGAAALLALIAWFENRERTPDRRYWLALTVLLSLAALDEAASIHEKFNRLLRGPLDASGFFYFTWVVPASLFVLVLAFAFWGFLRRLDPRTRRLFFTSGGIYLAGALGLEMVGGSMVDPSGLENAAYAAVATVEETLEMVGASILVYALLVYAQEHIGGVVLRFDSKGSSRSVRRSRANRSRSVLDVEREVELAGGVGQGADGNDVDAGVGDRADGLERHPT